MPRATIEFAHFVSVAMLPMVGAGIALGVAWRYVEDGALRTTLQTIAALLFFLPQPFALFLGEYSAGLRFYQQALLSLWGFGVGALALVRFRSGAVPPGRPHDAFAGVAMSREPSPTSRGRALHAAGVVAMTGLGVYCGWVTVGDYLLPHAIVAGTVDGARVIRHTRSPATYEVTIDQRPYHITLDLLARVNRGDYIEGETGAATRTILAIRRQVRSQSTGTRR
jgi:hypothetical protein